MKAIPSLHNLTAISPFYSTCNDQMEMRYNFDKLYNKYAATNLQPYYTEELKKLIESGHNPTAFLRKLLMDCNKLLPPLKQMFTETELRRYRRRGSRLALRTILIENCAVTHLRLAQLQFHRWLVDTPQRIDQYQRIHSELLHLAMTMNRELEDESANR